MSATLVPCTAVRLPVFVTRSLLPATSAFVTIRRRAWVARLLSDCSCSGQEHKGTAHGT